MPTDGALPRLRHRIALLRERIERVYVHVHTLKPNETVATAEFNRFVVDRSTCSQWSGEPVVVWHRGLDFWAMQEACPHAAISLEASDIEDLMSEFPNTQGPCISCPAHAYIFDLGSGACLTNANTNDARRYPVGLTVGRWPRLLTASTGDDDETDDDALQVWLGREPLPPAVGAREAVGQKVGDAIQIQLVRRALERKFGAFDEDEVDEAVR